MGALHAGHMSLVERSKRECDHTAVSIFVNPKQFGPSEDFTKYPRPLESDLAKLATLEVDLVFTPEVDEMYPAGFASQVEVAGVTKRLEGEFRPGHLRGVTTVVMKLFQIVPADRAYFGRKDYQQAITVRQMVADMNLPIEIIICPLVRDSDGLALSSRNVYLGPDERRSALVLPRSLQLAREVFAAGQRNAAKIRHAVEEMITAQPGVRLEYAAVVHPDTLDELSQIDGSAVVLLAARIGATRLIDNEVLGAKSDMP